MDFINETLVGALVAILDRMAGAWGDALWSWWSRFFLVPTAVVNNPDALRVNELLVGVSLAAMPVLIAAAALRNALERSLGTSTMAPEELIKRSILAGLAVTATPTLTWAGAHLANLAVGELGALGIDLDAMKSFFLFADMGLSVLLLLIIFLVGAAVIMIQRLVLAAELAILLAIGPLMGLGYLQSAEGGMFKSWCREVASIVMTPPLQLLLTWFFIKTFTGVDPDNPSPVFASFAYLYLLFKIPRWARDLVYSAGGGSLIAGGGVAVARMAAIGYMVRRLKG